MEYFSIEKNNSMVWPIHTTLTAILSSDSYREEIAYGENIIRSQMM